MTTPTPARRPVATWPAILIALSLIALAVVGIRELAVALGWAQGQPWAETAVQWVDGRGQDFRIVAVAVVLALAGLMLLYTVVRPARRTHLLTSTDPEVWINRKAVSSIAEQAIKRVPGVQRVSAKTRRNLAVRVAVTDPQAEVQVREVIDRSIGGFLPRPAKINIREVTR